MVPISLLHASVNTLTIISVTHNSIYLAYKLYAIIKRVSWMLNVIDLNVIVPCSDAKIFENSYICKRLRILHIFLPKEVCLSTKK